MKKSDLKNGMAVEIDGDLFFLINDVFVSMDGYMPLDLYSEDLKEGNRKYNVTKVFEVLCWGSGFNCISNNRGERLHLLWERKKEIDWSKVPRDTPVVSKGEHGGIDWSGKFLAYVPSLECPFICYSPHEMTARSLRKIALRVEPKDEWLVEER